MSYKDFIFKNDCENQIYQTNVTWQWAIYCFELRIDLMILPNSQTNQYGKNNFLK